MKLAEATAAFTCLALDPAVRGSADTSQLQPHE